jgi:photosystem II stability/assembly factor-like uncharacterized protein
VVGATSGAADLPKHLDIYRIAFADTRHGLISLASPKIPCPSHICTWYVQATSDGGRSWSTTLRGPVSLVGHAEVEAAPGTSVVWAYFPCTEPTCRPRLYRSSDWGRQWRLVGHPRLERLRFFSPSDGWGLTGALALVASHDGGRSWRPVPKQPCPPDNPVGVGTVAVAPVSSRHGWVLCTDGQLIEQAAGVYETRDGARSWHVRAQRGSPPQMVGRGVRNLFALVDLAFSASGRGWIWRYAGVPLRTTDAGRSWRPVAGWPFPRKTSGVRRGSAVSESQAFALTNRPGGPIVLLRTSDGGRSWAIVHRWPHP